MNLLALETSTDACSVALLSDNDVMFDHRIVPQKHAQVLLPMIDQMLSNAGLKANALDGIAFGAGPGSFTGVRIAAATAQGLSFGANVGVIAVSSLQALAQGAQRLHNATHALACLDARMGEVYWGAYSVTDGQIMNALFNDSVCPPSEVPLPENANQRDWFLVGSGADQYKDELPVRFGNTLQAKHVADAWPNAQDILSVALPAARRGEFSSPEKALPVYLRNRVALTEAERAQGQRL